MSEFKKALKKGAVLKSDKYIYTIVEPEQQDGFGITYLATGVPLDPPAAPKPRPGLGVSAVPKPEPVRKFIVREHFMFHCSDRGEDDKELAIDEYSESTGDDFQAVFKNTMVKLKNAIAGAD
ncbi:MAG: hypothetical protein K2H98_01105 [Duncaniella sp.]|nr:hypothetical protein [Duncaniella sp.]